MALVLDTSILVDIERKTRETVKRLEEISKNHFLPPRITFISYFEFYEGIIEKNIKNKSVLMVFINKFMCLRASSRTAEILANLKHKYGKKGITFGLADLIIAAQVIENNATLVTKDNVFEKIEEMDKIIV